MDFVWSFHTRLSFCIEKTSRVFSLEKCVVERSRVFCFFFSVNSFEIIM